MLNEFDNDMQNSEMGKLLMAEEDNYQEIYKGSIIKGTVMIEKDDAYYVDLNYKTDGILPKDQVLEEEEIHVGDVIDIQVLKIDKNTGDILLSKKRVDEFNLWSELEIGQIIPVHVTDSNAKGLLATYKDSLRGFIPLSHVEIKFIGESQLKNYIGKTFEVEVIDVDPRKRRLIFSRKNILAQKQEEMKKEIIDKIVEGAIFDGVIRDIKDYGLFVDIGGITGLVHVSEVSWDRNDNIHETYEIDQNVKVQVIQYDTEKERLSLSIKSMQTPPRDEFLEKFNVGDIVTGEVKNIKEYGAFINLYPTVDGFVHISNLSSDFIKNPNEFIKVGEKVEVKILNIDKENDKIELTMILQEPEEETEESQESAEEIQSLDSDQTVTGEEVVATDASEEIVDLDQETSVTESEQE